MGAVIVDCSDDECDDDCQQNSKEDGTNYTAHDAANTGTTTQWTGVCGGK